MAPTFLLLILLFTFSILSIVFIELHRILKNADKLHEELREERDIAKAIVASMGEGLLVLDTDYKIKLINPAAEKFLETSVKEAVGQKWAEFGKAYIGDKPIPFNKRSAVISLTKGTVKITTITDDHYYVTRSGRKFPVVAITAPLVHNNQVIGIVKVFRDATKEKDIDRMKTDFISLASHQLRTPLSAIKWFCELLVDPKSGTLNPEQKEYSKNIATSTERMIDLVNSLLNISRIESGRIMVEPKSTRLLELVKEIVSQLEKKIETKKIKFIISSHEKLPTVNIDPKLIGHVYMNLLDNAIKYTTEGGEITVFISKKDQEIISQITDSGYGIPKDEQNKMFQKFFRATNIVRHETEGTGLGLYLAKAIVESSGGKIWYRSEENKGTTFWFSLPVSGMKPKKGEVSLD
ncbi:PAS domain S-box protein [Candidatus Roizmanbacteria bacterium]|nr:PAS domain S-box protein [Candidatus Roizmanbacteria bacterium]